MGNGSININKTKVSFLQGDRDSRDADLFDAIQTTNLNFITYTQTDIADKKCMKDEIQTLQRWRYTITGGLLLIAIGVPILLAALKGGQ